ncbi:VWA-like domain-containing protein [Synechococcus sp. CBW1006]|uniref:vWA domain-containing protein n=1 Tax=Synechococcus sp. CBW1006 TaxID=1353138 RepID=UPI0018CCD988|nr:VWA-like domain-containing protein [Synechococcus sp. CBW1006]QPN66568.1 hypothetical protein H8F26_17895 [Synechococcus sp. CBW1006]
MENSLLQRAESELDQAIVMVLRKEPFYGHLLGSVVRRIDARIATAAVTLSPVGVSLVVNPEFFLERLSPEERCGVIKHEILHLVLRHLFRFEDPGTDRMQLNVAADLVVNQLVHPWPLPASAITLASFPQLQLRPGKSVEHYYRRLEQQCRQASGFESTLRRLCDGSPSDHGHWAAAGGEGFSNPGSSEVMDAGKPLAPELSEQLTRIFEEAFNRQVQRARARLSDRQWGDLPGSIRSLVESAAKQATATVDWKRALRLFASAGYRTRVVATTRRRSKRFGTYPGVRISRERSLAVVVDTSGSIGPQTLALFFAEIDRISHTGADILVIECDAAVGSTYTYRGVPPSQVHGGGGTAFNPAFRWLREESRKRYDGCIYLTDGYADAPTVRPPCRLLWVISPDGRGGEHLRWGKQIQMEGI